MIQVCEAEKGKQIVTWHCERISAHFLAPPGIVTEFSGKGLCSLKHITEQPWITSGISFKVLHRGTAVDAY